MVIGKLTMVERWKTTRWMLDIRLSFYPFARGLVSKEVLV
jgi:hypothetical protein